MPSTGSLSLLAVQVVTGLATALARPDAADGTPGPSLALGVLVPVFGFGLNGWWAAFHGTFDPRVDDEALAGRRVDRSPTSGIDQNGDPG